MMLLTSLKSSAENSEPELNAAIDTSRYAVLKYDKSRDGFIFGDEYKAATLSVNEIEKIEDLIAKGATIYNKEVKDAAAGRKQKTGKQASTSDLNLMMLEHTTTYYKQLIAVVNDKGEKIVWANCFCARIQASNWRRGVVLVMDGGSCFFNLKINLSTHTVFEIKVNGVA